MSDKEYNPIGCQHKNDVGLTTWTFQSESSGSGPETNYRVCVFVCSECGEVKVSGHRWDGKSKHSYHFSEEFSIYHPDAIDAIIKSANFFNEKKKWGRSSFTADLGVWIKYAEKKPDSFKVKFKDIHGNKFIGNYSNESSDFYAYGFSEPITDVIEWTYQDDSEAADLW